MSGIYNILDQIISEKANTADECETMQSNIQSHLNAELNWDKLSDKEQSCLIIWEQEMEAVGTPVKEVE